ncbi:MAG: hypothetical protein WBB42_07570 [Polyangiales bacterium]
MLRYFSVVLVGASFLLASSCANGTVVQTGQVIVDYDETFDFSQLETFSIVTEELAPPGTPVPGPDERLFNERVNELIIEAMTSTPVCLELVEPDQITDESKHVWAANGLARTTGEGTYWECVGGWFWGWWGWQWDPCAWVRPIPVEFDVGNLLIPVGPRPQEGENPDPSFVGLAQSVVGNGSELEAKARAAVDAIFAQWPYKQTCTP